MGLCAVGLRREVGAAREQERIEVIEGLVRVRHEVRVGREQRRDAARALDRLDVAHGHDGGVHLPHAGPRRVLDRGRDADDRARHHSQGSDVASPRVMPSPSTTKMPGRAMGTPRPHAFRRRLAIAVPLALVGMLIVSSAAHAGLLAPEAGGSKNADAIRTLYWLVFGLGVIIFIGVEGVLIYSLFKYRARKGAVAAQIHGNTQLEIGWTVGAAVILVFIAIFTFATLPTIRNPPNSDAAAAEHGRDHERRRGRADRRSCRPTASRCRSTSTASSTSGATRTPTATTTRSTTSSPTRRWSCRSA